MIKNEGKWATIIVVMILLAYIVPYTLLNNMNVWYGAFLFWTVFALGIILVNILMTKDWSE